MPIHNESFDFNRDASAEDKRAFVRPPERRRFESGTRLYRFLTRHMERSSGMFSSPWWTSTETYGEIARAAHVLKTSITDVARVRLAVTRDFNPGMNEVCRIQLTKAAYAWVGLARYQGRNLGDSDVLLMGGLEQVYLPNLSGTDRASGDWSSPVAVILFHGPIT
jgi:hypothetical protein